MNYAAADVKKLREETGATFNDCKNALADAHSWDEAIKILDAKRDKKAEKMTVAGRETKQGGVFSYVHHNHNVGVLLELNCSTDFVAHSETFRKLASELTLQIAGMAPQYVNFEDVPADVVEEASVLRVALLDHLLEILALEPRALDQVVGVGDVRLMVLVVVVLERLLRHVRLQRVVGIRQGR